MNQRYVRSMDSIAMLAIIPGGRRSSARSAAARTLQSLHECKWGIGNSQRRGVRSIRAGPARLRLKSGDRSALVREAADACGRVLTTRLLLQPPFVEVATWTFWRANPLIWSQAPCIISTSPSEALQVDQARARVGIV
jgi:hypothetical protein